MKTTYQYWDGSHQAQTIVCKKGNTIGEFIRLALSVLGTTYKNLEGAPVEGFMYVKGDYIIPPVSFEIFPLIFYSM